MNQIKCKVYYEINSGSILTITGEGNIVERTKEEDLKFYQELESHNEDEVDFIELRYGTLAITFNNAKSYKVNAETNQLEVTYYTEEELASIKQQNQAVHELNTRILDISQYLYSNEIPISDVEDLILKSEQNKITEGVI